jgi:hypothetical protein
MFKKISLLAVFFTFCLISNAQKEVSMDNSVSYDCECFTFVDACSGEELDIQGSVTLSCILEWDDRPWNRTYPIVDGKLCISGALEGCKDSRLCVNSGSWEVCDISGCEIELFQTLSTYPRINGDLIGYGWGTPGGTSGYTYCVGEVHSGPLNNIHGRDELALCPGDPVILQYSGLSIPDKSGLCLTVNIKTTSGSVVATDTYNSDDVTGNTVDLTSLFSGLDTEIYIIEFIMACCDGTETCTVNTYKYAYIELLGSFSYDPIMAAGFFPDDVSFTPSTTFPGTQLPANTPLPPFLLNQVNLIGFNVNATEDVDVSWSLDEIDCTTQSVSTNISSSSFTVEEGDPTFDTGSNLLISQASSCTCYKMSLSYFDICEDEDVTTDYFFKNGPNCPDFTGDDDTKARSNNTGNIKVIPNPVENEFSLEIDNAFIGNQGSLSIYNMSGTLVMRKEYDVLSNQVNLQFADNASGIYVYKFKINDQVFTGKFVKM